MSSEDGICVCQQRVSGVGGCGGGRGQSPQLRAPLPPSVETEPWTEITMILR